MKAKKLLAVALAAGMLIGGGTKALDLTIPTAYAKETPAEVFTIEVTTTKPDGSVAKSTVTGKDVEEAKKNVAEKAEKIDGYKIKIDFSADNKTANVTYEKEEQQVKTWDVNVSLQINVLGGAWKDVPGATITLTNNDTGALVHTYTTTTDNDGYAHAKVPEGNYTLTVTNLPTGGILADKTYRWQGASSVSIKIEGPTSQPFHLEELFTLVSKYVDTEGNVIAPEETAQFNWPQVYQGALKPNPKEIEGYKYKKYTRVRVSPGKGTYTYIYQKISTKYVDTEGKEIAPEEKGTKGKKDIDGYTYLRTDEDENGSLTHVYIRNLVITVHIYKPRDNRVFKTEWYHSKDYGLDIEHTRGVISNLVAINYSPNYRLEILDNGLTLNYYLLDDSKVADNGNKTEEETEKKPDTKPEDKPEIKPEDGKDNSDENKAKDLIDKLNKNTKEIERILKENEANQDKEPDKKPDEKPDKKPESKKNEGKQAPAKKKSNPKTGVAGISLVAGSLALASAALVATKKKNK